MARIDMIITCDGRSFNFVFTDMNEFSRDILMRFLDKYELLEGIGRELANAFINRNKELVQYYLDQLGEYLSYSEEFIDYVIRNYCPESSYVYVEFKLVSL